MHKRILLAIAIIICFSVNAQTTNSTAQTRESLNKEEQKILAYIDANMPRAIALLKESVNINSGTLNIEGVKKVGALFTKELQAAGLQTDWVSMPDSIKRAGHLVAVTAVAASRCCSCCTSCCS
jgi:glutamate carboxypeptidase